VPLHARVVRYVASAIEVEDTVNACVAIKLSLSVFYNILGCSPPRF